MTFKRAKWARPIAALAVMGIVASCGLPTVGPNKRQIYSGSVQREGDAFVVVVNDRVTRATAVTPTLGFSQAFQNAGVVGSDTISPGDVLGLTIWENVDDGLLAGEGQNSTILEEVQVDGAGFIFVPYAGRIRAAGNTPEAIRGVITRRLEDQTPDPQVQVRRIAGDGATVSIIGAVGGQGVYAIERPTRTLATMLSQAGGVAVEPDIARVTVTRGGMSDTIWFNDLFENPHLDIALRGGDKILVEEDARSFTALGATGAQARVDFDSQTLSALEAIATVGGLNASTADPTGVFVIRNEAAPVANSVLARDDLQGAQRMVYVIDLTEPNGLFKARDFVIRDNDTIFVTEAPYSQFTRIISSLLTPASAVGSLQSIGGN